MPATAQKCKHVVMISAENGALVKGKVGGLADVIRDLPVALGKEGWTTTIITPSYGILHTANPSKMISSVTFPFRGIIHQGEIFEVTAVRPHDCVRHLVIEHPQIRGNPIYLADPPNQPYARDATKYAMFCSAVGKYLSTCDDISVIHLHDWHTGVLLLLKERHPAFVHLRKYRIVFTIHNLSFQGSRPMHGDQASVERWFPELFADINWVNDWIDHRNKIPIFTPLTAGINRSDMVNTVSPTYAEEIQKPSDPENGFHGGEGLEMLLQKAHQQNRLTGILNGIEYPNKSSDEKITFHELLDLIRSQVNEYNKTQLPTLSKKVTAQIDYMYEHPAGLLLTGVTRISDQKIRIFFEPGSMKQAALETILDLLQEYNGYFILIGNGDPKYERLFEQHAAMNNRLLYLKLYSDPIAGALYKNGILFMMPSLFEPCGITQMIAMREGQPCIVHATGGLKDTVIDGINGFQYGGNTIQSQVDNLVQTVKRALDIFTNDKTRWELIAKEAARARFGWENSAKKYIKILYNC